MLFATSMFVLDATICHMQVGLVLCATTTKISIEISCLCNYVATTTNFVHTNGWFLFPLLYKYIIVHTYSYISDQNNCTNDAMNTHIQMVLGLKYLLEDFLI